MLTRTIARYGSWPIDRLAALLAATGIPPNVITWSALAGNFWAGVLFAKGRFAAGGGIMILAGLCDLLDGPVARRQDRISLFGGFELHRRPLCRSNPVPRPARLLRTGEPLPVCRARGCAAMAGAVMVSYAKARAESLVPQR